MKEIHGKFLVLAICIFCLFVFGYCYSYPPLDLIQFDAANFPMKKIWSQKLDSGISDITVIESKSLVIARTVNKIFALDIKQGGFVWQTDSPQVFVSAPAIYNGSILFVNDENSLLALRPEDGRILWSQPLNSHSTWIPDASNKLVLVNELGSYVKAYDAKLGSLLWSFGVTTGRKPSYIKDDVVYIVDYGIKAIDAKTGNTLWSETSAPVRSSAYAAGIIYYTPGDKLVAFDVTRRKELWSQDLYTSPDSITIVNNFILTTTQLYFRAYDKLDGHLVWEIPVELPTNPSAINSLVYVRDSYAVKIRAFDINTGKDAGALRIAFPWFTIERKDLTSYGNMLFFSRGNELLAFEK